MNENRPGYSTLIHGKVVDNPHTLQVEDETVESQNSQRGDIINLQLGNVNNNICMNRQASGEIRYKEGNAEEE